MPNATNGWQLLLRGGQLCFRPVILRADGTQLVVLPLFLFLQLADPRINGSTIRPAVDELHHGAASSGSACV